MHSLIVKKNCNVRDPLSEIFYLSRHEYNFIHAQSNILIALKRKSSTSLFENHKAWRWHIPHITSGIWTWGMMNTIITPTISTLSAKISQIKQALCKIISVQKPLPCEQFKHHSRFWSFKKETSIFWSQPISCCCCLLSINWSIIGIHLYLCLMDQVSPKHATANRVIRKVSISGQTKM